MRRWDWQDWAAFIFDLCCLVFLVYVVHFALSPVLYQAAQLSLVEQSPDKRQVLGSNPSAATMENKMKIDHNVKPYSYHPCPHPPDEELDHCYTCGLRFYKEDKKVFCSLCGDKLHDKPKEAQ